MDLLESLEIRWFLPNDHPSLSAAQNWFSSAASEQPRVDDYLITGRTDLGFKARAVQGKPTKVETKYLVGSLGHVRVASGAVGKLERWRKLSLALDDAELKKNGSWRAVEKARRLRKFAFERDEADEVAADSRPLAGCGVELTRLGVRDSARAPASVEWTLGFEAFGPELGLLEILQATCRAALQAGLKLELRSEWSMSYAEWLESA